jgi:cell division protease FtsH
LAARRNKHAVTMAELEDAKDKVMMGAERRSMVMTSEDKKLTAYHEAGHAMVGLHMPGHDPLHKVTIIPRGRALGITFSLPERDRYAWSRQELQARLASLFGGRVAEELIFGAENVTSGAASDIREATSMARKMVTEWGMSEKLGPLRYCDNEEEIFLGHSVTQRKNVSDATAQLIDEETRALIQEAEDKARTILTENMDDLHTLAGALLEYESLSGEEVNALLRGEPIVRPIEEEEVESSKKKEGRHASVPASGAAGEEKPGGMEPEPQPGS